MRSGTTIQFKVGYLKNPPSLKPSGFFKISTYLVDPDTLAFNYINKNDDTIQVTNTQPGPITITNIDQTDKELSQPNALKFTFETSQPIPQTATMIFTLPNNIHLDPATTMTINGVAVSPILNTEAKQFTLTGLP